MQHSTRTSVTFCCIEVEVMINKWMLIGVVAGLGIATAGAVVALSMRDNGDQEMAADVADVATGMDVSSEEAAPAAAAAPAAVPHPATSTPTKKPAAKTPKPAAQVASAPAAAPAPTQR